MGLQKHLPLITGLLVTALASACSGQADSDSTEEVSQIREALTSAGLQVNLNINSHWANGYCATVNLVNQSSSTLAWQVDIDMGDAALQNGWSGTYNTSGGVMSVTPPPWATSLAPGGNTGFGYCASISGANWQPELVESGSAPSGDLAWPIDCTPGVNCSITNFPDPDGDGKPYDCSETVYTGHEGTDIAISWSQMDAGVNVSAAADGEVVFVSDGKFDRCPNSAEPDCADPTGTIPPGGSEGHTVCTDTSGPWCPDGSTGCHWCFAGGNVVIILHNGLDGVYATRYDHFKKNSINVSEGDLVTQGQTIGQVGSAGNSSGPHLHIEVWGASFYDPVDPFLSEGCGTNTDKSLWINDPPWSE